MNALTEKFKEGSPKVNFNITRLLGSGTGLADARSKSVSFGMRSSVYINSSDDNKTLDCIQIAWDGVAIVVSSAVSNALEGYITINELKAVYNGSDASLNAQARAAVLKTLVPINREAGSGTRDCFNNFVAPGTYKSGMKEATTTEMMAQYVKDTTNGIGYMSYGSVSGSGLSALKVAPAGGNDTTANKAAAKEISAANIINGSYIISRPFVLLRMKGWALTAAEKEFIDFVLSAPGQEVIIKAGFEGLTVAELNTNRAILGLPAVS